MKQKNLSRATAWWYTRIMKYRTMLGFGALVLVALVGLYALHVHSMPRIVAGAGDETDEDTDNPEESAGAVALAVSAPKVKYLAGSTTPQFVLLSFDGSKSVNMLNETLDFEQMMQAKGKSLHFTYFINAAYFLSKDTAQLYQSPRAAKGLSNIGFSNAPQDIPPRVKAFNMAFAQGNEIGSHTVGHYNGSTWTYAEWQQEFNSFASLMSNVQQNNPGLQIDAPTFAASIHGFRAPNLGVDDNLYKVLGDFHFTYDTSGVGAPEMWPQKDAYGVWHIPLGIVFVGTHKSPTVAMDYNLFKRQSNLKETAVKGTPLWNTYFDQVLAAYMAYFNTNYNGSRAPVVIGGHFSKFNDGVYWEAMKTFADYVCGQAQVRCVTYKELVDYLNQNGAPPTVQ